MYCVCQNNATGELTIMTRTERERHIGVLIDLNADIPTWVISVKETKEDAEKYIRDQLSSTKIINDIL